MARTAAETKQALARGRTIGCMTTVGLISGMALTWYILHHLLGLHFAWALVAMPFAATLSAIAFGYATIIVVLQHWPAANKVAEAMLLPLALLGGAIFAWLCGPRFVAWTTYYNDKIGNYTSGHVLLAFAAANLCHQVFKSTRSRHKWFFVLAAALLGLLGTVLLGPPMNRLYMWFNNSGGNRLIGYGGAFFIGLIAVVIASGAFQLATGIGMLPSESKALDEDQARWDL